MNAEEAMSHAAGTLDLAAAQAVISPPSAEALVKIAAQWAAMAIVLADLPTEEPPLPPCPVCGTPVQLGRVSIEIAESFAPVQRLGISCPTDSDHDVRSTLIL